MKELVIAVFLLMIVASAGIILARNWPGDELVRYDCSLAEISPDMPLEVKQACRKLRMEKITK